jgi:hypothetical protein
MVKVRMSTVTGASSEISVGVQVPQSYGFELSEEITELGIAAGSSRQFTFMLTNTGNGDDEFTISLADNIPEGFEITPMESKVTVPKDTSRSQAFTVFAPSTWDGSTKTVRVTVTSENGVDTSTFDVELKEAMISLRFKDGDVQTASDTDADTENSQLRIPIENFGYLDATGSVIVHLTYQSTGEEFAAQTISIPAQTTVNAVFDVGEMAVGSQRFDYRVEVVGEDSEFVEQGIEDGDFSVEYYVVSEETDDTWITILVFALIPLILFGGVKLVRGGSGSKKF